MRKSRFLAKVDSHGGLRLPKEVCLELGLLPGAEVPIRVTGEGLHVARALNDLSRIYIEPTNQCNLNCRTCVRNVWDVPLGTMSWEIFEKLMEEAGSLPRPPSVFLGGFGEPLLHPQILGMVERARGLGAGVELITNGTLLDEGMCQGLIRAGLDRLWVSLDGVTSQGYGSVRPGSPLETVLENLERFHGLATGFRPFGLPKPALGIAFVATKTNLGELPEVISLASRLGATEVLVTNVLPHTREMAREGLFQCSLSEMAFTESIFRLRLPRMDTIQIAGQGAASTLRGGFSVSLMDCELGEGNGRCPFVERGAMVVGWQGDVSPCLPLLYDHTEHLDQFERRCKSYIVGSLRERSLLELWMDPGHLQFRKRVHGFDFSPCTLCGGCDMLESNEEDCFGNTHPTCGGCLFAHGVVRCP